MVMFWLFQGSLVKWVINPTEEQIAAFKAAGEAYAKQKLNGLSLKMLKQ